MYNYNEEQKIEMMEDAVVVFRGYLDNIRGYLSDNSMEIEQIICSFFHSELFRSKYMFFDPSGTEEEVIIDLRSYIHHYSELFALDSFDVVNIYFGSRASNYPVVVLKIKSYV